MGVFSKIFGKKETKAEKKELKINLDIIHEKSENVEDVAYLSYAEGLFTIPVEGFVQGVKRMGTVKAFDMKSGRFIELKELGESLILYTPESGAIPLIHITDEKYNFIKEFVFEGKRFDSNYDYDESEEE